MNIRLRLVGVIILTLSLLSADPLRAQEAESENVAAPVEEPERKPPEPSAPKQIGLAAYYHADFHGRRTANGESFDHNGLTAAHKTLPFGTHVRVINLQNNKNVIVRVNDRGPVQTDRVIDLTRRAASILGFIRQGMAKVALEVVPLGSGAK